MDSAFRNELIKQIILGNVRVDIELEHGHSRNGGRVIGAARIVVQGESIAESETTDYIEVGGK